MRISPALMFSSPAIMRSSVDLPQPEGPTSTQNSPSAIEMSTPCSTSVWPKDLRAPLIATAAMLLHRLAPVGGVAPAGQVHVAAHRGARPRGVARHDGGEHGRVVAQGPAGHRRIFEV